MGSNDWGETVDRALLRRVLPLRVTLDERVVSLFSMEMQGGIRYLTSAARDGTIPVGLDYGTLSRAKGPDDKTIMYQVFARIQAGNEAAYETLATTFPGLYNIDVKANNPWVVGQEIKTI